MTLRAPFPWFGGKSRAASLIWERFGDVANYVEPFAGSLAVLLARPTEPKIETVNDLDCHVANFWRAVQADPDAVAKWCDWPVNEADLHARHLWLVQGLPAHRERMMTEPDYFDAKIAGWWVWGICQWIGSGWCAERKPPIQRPHVVDAGMGVHRKRPHVGNAGRGVHRKLPHVGNAGMGVHRKLPHVGDAGMGVHRKLPHVGDAGRGVHRKLPHVGDAGRGVHRKLPHVGDAGRGGLFEELTDRLRRVRVCCGDWSRVTGDSVTWRHGLTGVLLDPPYADTADRDASLYREDSLSVAHDVRKWAIENGDNPLMRIALCGYDGEHDMPASWERVAWKANGGYGGQSKDHDNPNAKRERIWFSPHCIGAKQRSLF